MATLKSETRIKEVDTTAPETNATEYGQGDLVYDVGQGLMRHDGASFGGIQGVFDGMFINAGTLEKLIDMGGPNLTNELYDCSSAQVFYNYNPTGDWIANFVNFKMQPNSATTIIIIVNQDGTAQIPTGVTISTTSASGAAKQVLWAGGEKPTPTPNGTDVFCFTVFQLGNPSNHYVLAQMVSFELVG